jgi:hypothetical protein
MRSAAKHLRLLLTVIPAQKSLLSPLPVTRPERHNARSLGWLPFIAIRAGFSKIGIKVSDPLARLGRLIEDGLPAYVKLHQQIEI